MPRARRDVDVNAMHSHINGLSINGGDIRHGALAAHHGSLE
jgi:hypothetical protein